MRAADQFQVVVAEELRGDLGPEQPARAPRRHSPVLDLARQQVSELDGCVHTLLFGLRKIQ